MMISIKFRSTFIYISVSYLCLLFPCSKTARMFTLMPGHSSVVILWSLNSDVVYRIASNVRTDELLHRIQKSITGPDLLERLQTQRLSISYVDLV